MLEQLETLISETWNEIPRLSLAESWWEQLPYVIQLPGTGLMTGLVILSAIGDIAAAFPLPRN